MPNPRVRVPSSGDTAGARRTSRLRSTGKLLPERDSAGRGLLDLGWTGRRLPAFACLLAHCKLAGGKQVKALQVGLVIKSSMAIDFDLLHLKNGAQDTLPVNQSVYQIKV